jgi:sugar phosphate isomerase/epimerase
LKVPRGADYDDSRFRRLDNLPQELTVEKWPLGVFASIDAGLGVKLEVAHELGVPTIQLHAPAEPTRTISHAKQFLERLQAMGIRITAVFGGFEGESYADIPTVTRTVGLVPPETREARTTEMKEIADFARVLGVDVVALHLGFVPHDASDPLYREVLTVTRDICDHCARQQQALHLETGQEDADTLVRFIQAVERENLFINFDPANMILYGSGEPIEALEKCPLQGRQMGRAAGEGVGHRGSARSGGRRHGALFAHARSDRLSRAADDRARDPARSRAAEDRDRPGAVLAARSENATKLI